MNPELINAIVYTAVGFVLGALATLALVFWDTGRRMRR